VFAGTTERAVISGSFKASFDGSGPLRLFDLESDPGEQRNIVDSDPAAVVALHEMMQKQRLQAQELYLNLGSQQENLDVNLSEAERQRLKAFGYLE
jgi:arylsulfatase A-like enzyme